MRKTLAVDFDGVIHRNLKPWRGRAAIDDLPVAGAVEALASLRLDYNIIVHSCRARSEAGVKAIEAWLSRYGIAVDGVTAVKPGADVYLDDKAVRFEGDWTEGLKAVRTNCQTRPGNKRSGLKQGNRVLPGVLSSMGQLARKRTRLFAAVGSTTGAGDV